MANNSIRVFIRGARLSYPALDEPRASITDPNDKKYQATFLLEPTNESVQKIRDAIMQVANNAFGDKAKSVLSNPERIPLKRGDDKETIPEGYAGMLYISARSKDRPELRDANPRIMITTQEEIRTKFVAGYKVNGFIDIYPYSVKNPNGTVIKSGIGCGLVSVQFNSYADSFSGRAPTNPDDYPDCTAEAAASGGYTPAPAYSEPGTSASPLGPAYGEPPSASPLGPAYASQLPADDYPF